MSALPFMTASEAVTAIRAGEISIRDHVSACLAQIDRLNPYLKAFVSVRADDVLREADALDKRRAGGEDLPLMGLALAVKDNIDTAGIRTTHGSLEFEHNVPSSQPAFVTWLQEAGALIIGKTSLPEFAAYMNTRNKLVGTTRSPWKFDRSSGGSSGGTAVALATGMAALGIGTDYGGSVRVPCAFNGLVGLRGSPGLIQTYPSNWPFDTFAVAGPMCRTVDDLELMLKVMAARDPNSPLSFGPGFEGSDHVDPKKLKIAFSEDLNNLFPVDQDVRQVVRKAVAQMQDGGIGIHEASPDLSGIRDSIIPLRSVRTLILHSQRLDRIKEMGNELLVQSIERAQRTSALAVAEAEIARSTVWKKARPFFDDFDILITVATQTAGFSADEASAKIIDGQVVEEALDTCLATYSITMLGLPALVMPCGFNADGEPIGLQMIARLGREDQLIAFARELEKRFGWTNKLPEIATDLSATPPQS